MARSGASCVVLGLLAVAPFLAAAPGARAADPPSTPAAPAAPVVPEATLALERDVVAELVAGRFAAAAERLEADACAALAAAPTAAYDVAAAVTRSYALALEKDAAAAVALLERLGGLASADDPSPHASGVRTLGALLKSLTVRLHGQPTPLDDVRAAVAALRKLEAKLPSTAPAFSGAFDVARFVAAARPSDVDAWGAVLAVAEPLRKASSADESFAHPVATAELQRGLLLAATDAAAARPLLERALATFAARDWSTRKRDGRWTEDAGLFNRALTAAKALGGAAKVAYVHETFWSRGRSLSAKVPALSGWTWTYGESEQDYGTLVRKRSAEERVEIQIWGYNGWTEYSSPDGSVTPGENMDGFLKRGMKADRESLDKVLRDTRTTGPLGVTIKETKGYELKGVDYEGVPTRYRSWFFRHSLADRRYFNVILTQTGAYAEKDPEVLFLLDSLEEHLDAK